MIETVIVGVFSAAVGSAFAGPLIDVACARGTPPAEFCGLD